MILKTLKLTNFRCFGPETEVVNFQAATTAFIGSNGAGKTALMLALLRLFGVHQDYRRFRRQDFHIPVSETTPQAQRELVIEAIFEFPELSDEGADVTAIPEFFHQMAADDDGILKCRLRMTATWVDDGSIEGAIDEKFLAVRTLEDSFAETDCSLLTPLDRARIQMIYVPAIRDGASQMTTFLKGRLWRAIIWSEQIHQALSITGATLNASFESEAAIASIADAVKTRWQEVHSAGTDTKPMFRPVDLRFPEFIRKVEVIFHPDESGRDRSLEDLSDGQRSLFHLAMTAATLDIERKLASGHVNNGFEPGNITIPALTIICVEEPENNLSPFYLSRIISQINDITSESNAQAIISSHSPSILSRIEPEQVRHFRLMPATRSARVKEIELPTDTEDASKYIREAVRTFPELYFASFAILGEGSSEEVVIPKLAEAMKIPIDRSFVAIVPLGGKHVNHLWKLLNSLDIPHATLLDLDAGRVGGGWGRIKFICEQLIANGVDPATLLGTDLLPRGVAHSLSKIGARQLNTDAEMTSLMEWVTKLQSYGVFFSSPLDLDWSMLTAFPSEYQTSPSGARGPNAVGDAKISVLGENGDPTPYGDRNDERFLWYRYLFLGRSKPSTHVRVLGNLSNDSLATSAPDELKSLLNFTKDKIFGPATQTGNS